MRETDTNILSDILETAERKDTQDAVSSMFELLASDKDFVECK